jgi:catechol 2,3-dioxygenase-like lactoylglutathione lyase family enzyme
MRLDHVAHSCQDPRETHKFYATLLGLKLVQAYAGKDLMLVYALPGEGSLVFTTRESSTPANNDASDWERRHVGLTLDTRAEFDAWLHRLRECGIAHKLISDERVYFSDPNGLVLELEVAAPATFNAAAEEILANWRFETG